MDQLQGWDTIYSLPIWCSLNKIAFSNHDLGDTVCQCPIKWHILEKGSLCTLGRLHDTMTRDDNSVKRMPNSIMPCGQR